MADYIDWFVNRTKQFERFEEMLERTNPMLGMLIEAPTGMGKTFLVKRMRYRCQTDGIPLVHIDFRERRAHDGLWLARQTREQLSGRIDPQHFNALTETINQFTQPAGAAVVRPLTHTAELEIAGRRQQVQINTVDVRRQMMQVFGLSDIEILCFDLGLTYDDLAGQTLSEKVLELIQTCEQTDLLGRLVTCCAAVRAHIEWWQAAADSQIQPATAASHTNGAIAADTWGDLNGLSPQARDLAETQIGRVFRAALRAVQAEIKVVFLFDSFESRTDEAKGWIERQLLTPISERQFDQVVVIVAGQPPLGIDERKPLVRKTGLSPFSIEHVREYLIERRKIAEDDIDNVYRYCRGLPSVLATMADMAALDSADDDDW